MTEIVQLNNSPSSSFTQMPEINFELIKFKNDILSLISQTESKINDKISNYQSDNDIAKSNYESSMTSMNTKYDQISQSIASMSVKCDRFALYDAFTRKANDQIITQEIRLNNLLKDFSKACYKYDKIYLDNLILPGYIGDCCKFKTLKDFFDDVITQLSQLNSFKEKQAVEQKGYRDRLESVILNFNSQISGLNKVSMKYTNDSIKESEIAIKEMMNGVNSQINEISIDNNKQMIDLKKQHKELTEEIKKVMNMKSEIQAKTASDLEFVKKMNQDTKNSFDTFQSDIAKLKNKIGELAEFIKDVRFRKNLKVDIKKKEIASLVKKLNFKRSESMEGFKEKCLESIKGAKAMTQKNQIQSLSHDVESRLKGYINGETDIDHLNQCSKRVHNEEETDQEREVEGITISLEDNNKIIHELGAELEQSNCKNLKDSTDNSKFITQRHVRNESPIPTQSYSCKQISTVQMNNATINGDNNLCKSKNQRRHSLGSAHPSLNQKEKGKDKKDFDTKIVKTEKLIYKLQSFTQQKIQELSNQVSLLLSLNGFGLNVNGLIQSLGNIKGGSHSFNKHKAQKVEMHKDQDMSLSFSNKVMPCSIIDLVKKNNFPIPSIHHMSSTLGNTSLVVKPRIKACIKTKGQEPIDKMLMQTFGMNNHMEDANSNSSVRENQITPYSKDLNIKTGSNSFNNLADFRVSSKKGILALDNIHFNIEKKQSIHCESKITPGKYISLQKLMTNTPNSISNNSNASSNLII